MSRDRPSRDLLARDRLSMRSSHDLINLTFYYLRNKVNSTVCIPHCQRECVATFQCSLGVKLFPPVPTSG